MQVAIYARTSTNLQEKERTIESQIDALKEYARHEKLEITRVYKDDGWSGALLARPSLDELRDDVSKGLFEGVLIYDASRLSRRYAHQVLLSEELEEKGIKVIFLDSPSQQSTEDKILSGFKGLFAEYEREKIKERCRRGKLYKAKLGKIVGHEAPYGYTYNHKAKDAEAYYSINESEAEIVRMIFRMLANEHMSIRGIIKRLHDLDIKPRDGKDFWASSTLSRLVRREDYIGKAYYNKSLSIVPKRPNSDTNNYKRIKKSSRIFKPKEDWLPVMVPQIIENKIFQQAQHQLTQNQLLSPRNIKRTYLLRGLITCAKCSSKFAGEHVRGHKYYRSTIRLRRFPLKANCDCKSINARIIEEIVWNELKKLMTNPKLIKKQYNLYLKSKEANQFKLNETNSDFELQLKSLGQAEQRLVDAYTTGVISLELIKPKLENIRNQKFNILSSLKEHTNEENKLSIKPIQPEDICKSFATTLSNINDDMKDKLIHLLVSNIQIQERSAIIKGYIPTNYDSESVFRSNNYDCGASR